MLFCQLPKRRDRSPRREGRALDFRVTDTAAAIARVRAEERKLPVEQRLFEDPFATLFAANRGPDELVERFLSIPFFRPQVRLRTRFIDDLVREALAEQTKQIVILGAGFDCRALRLAEVEQCGALVYEVDLPVQLAAKQEIFREAGILVPEHIRSFACDFSSANWGMGLRENLIRSGLSPDDPALFLCEGVLSYLTHEEIARALGWMAVTAGRGSKSIFNYAVTWIAVERIAELAARAGFHRLDDSSLLDLYGRYFSDEPPPGGELFRIAVAWA